MNEPTDRFQFYAVCEDAEETLRRCCVRLNELAFWLPVPSELKSLAMGKKDPNELADYSEIINHYAKEASDGLFKARMCGGDFSELHRMLNLLSGHKIAIEGDVVFMETSQYRMEICKVDDFATTLAICLKLADKSLADCRAIKRRLEGAIRGNWYALRLLFRAKPFTKNDVLRMVEPMPDRNP